MDLKCNRTSISFIKPIFKLSSLFCVTPYYSFQERKLVCTKMFKCCSVFLASLVTMLSLSFLYVRFQYVYIKMASILVILDILLELYGLILVVVTILGSSFWNMQTWQELLKLIYHLESTIDLIIVEGKKTNPLKNANVIFLIGNLYLLALFTHHLLIRRSFTPEIGDYYASLIILSYVEFLLATIIFNVTLSIKCKYEALNKLLLTCYSNIFTNNVVITVRKVKNLYLALNKILETFNKLFGWPLLLLFSHSVLQILDWLVYLSPLSLKWLDLQDNLPIAVMLVNFGYGFESMVLSMIIIFSCDSTVDESDELLTGCYSLEQLLPLLPEEKEELRSLERVVKNKRPKFTAAGFFQINRSTMLSLLGTITTYYIVAMQFNSQ